MALYHQIPKESTELLHTDFGIRTSTFFLVLYK